jgi:hypothetical protein
VLTKLAPRHGANRKVSCCSVTALIIMIMLLGLHAGDAEDGIVSLAVQYLYERVGSGATGATHDLKCGSGTSKSIPEQSIQTYRRHCVQIVCTSE